MVGEQDLQALVEFGSDDPPVVTLYLNVDPTQRAKDEYRLSLRNLLKEAGGKASSKDIQAIERYFDFEYDGSAKGAAIFSCQDGGLWKVFTLAVPVDDRVVVASRPYFVPLQDVLDGYSRYGVALVDKEGARLFLFERGELQEVSGTLGSELKKHKQGGPAASRLQRRAGEIAHQNLKDAVRLTRAFCDENQCKQLILAGTEENVAAFRNMLPKAVRDNVVGEMAIDMWAGEIEVRDKATEIIRRYTRNEEEQLVQRMITSAAKGDAAIVGLADTLHMLQQERVHTLLVAQGFEHDGAFCPHCGFLASQPLDNCPYCGTPMKATDHLIDHAVRQAVERGITVRIISHSEPLIQTGNVGAILRY